MPTRILIADAEPAMQEALHRLVSALGHESVLAGTVDQVLATLARSSVDLCVADVELPGGGVPALLHPEQAPRPWVPLIASSRGPVDRVVSALRAGALDFLPRPFDAETAAQVVREALASRWQSGASHTCGAALIGEHPAMRVVFERIDQVAESGASVLISGEAGTGKLAVARLLHLCGTRRAGHFARVRVPADDDAALEHELFGSDDSGPPGGKLTAPRPGTLYIEEIADLPRELQIRLARVLRETGGGSGQGERGTRVIAGTARNLEQAARDGLFLEDLYYRLNVIPIELPPLRERPEDIPVVVEHVRAAANARHGCDVPPFSPEVIVRLGAYHWPGNVTQLEAMVERLVTAARSRPVALGDLPASLRTDVSELGPSLVDLPPHGVDLRLLLTQLEERLIGQALERTGGNKNRAAELLGMNRTTLVEKLRRRTVA